MRLLYPSLLKQVKLGLLGRNTVLGTTGLGVRACFQAAYLLLLSRWLGAEDYGLFAGSVAAVVLLAPLANWGMPLVLTRYVARDRKNSRAAWASALQQTSVVGGLLTVLVLAISAALLHERVGMQSMAWLALSELVFLPAAQVATSQFFALEHGLASAISICLVPVCRLLAIAGMVLVGMRATPAHAAIGHFIGSVAGFACASVLIAVIDGRPAWRKRLSLFAAIKEGTPYALGKLAGTSYQEVDKVLMLQLVGAMIVGPYTAGFRVISIFALPVVALISATLPRMMNAYSTGSSARTYEVVVLVALGYGLLASIAAAIISPWVPYVFGPGYEAAARYVLLLSPWPLLYAWHQVMATRLTATDRQHMRVVVEVTGLLLVFVFNLLLLRRMGPEASIVVLVCAEVFMAAMCWLVGSMEGASRRLRHGRHA